MRLLTVLRGVAACFRVRAANEPRHGAGCERGKRVWPRAWGSPRGARPPSSPCVHAAQRCDESGAARRAPQPEATRFPRSARVRQRWPTRATLHRPQRGRMARRAVRATSSAGGRPVQTVCAVRCRLDRLAACGDAAEAADVALSAARCFTRTSCLPPGRHWLQSTCEWPRTAGTAMSVCRRARRPATTGWDAPSVCRLLRAPPPPARRGATSRPRSCSPRFRRRSARWTRASTLA